MVKTSWLVWLSEKRNHAYEEERLTLRSEIPSFDGAIFPTAGTPVFYWRPKILVQFLYKCINIIEQSKHQVNMASISWSAVTGQLTMPGPFSEKSLGSAGKSVTME